MRVAPAVTAFALLAHAILGCCSHHAHATATAIEPPVAPTAGNCCDGHGCHEGQPIDGDEHEPGPCDEVECSFASGGDRLTVDSPLLGLVLPLVELAPRPVGCAGQTADGSVATERHQGAAIFVLHQRLVI